MRDAPNGRDRDSSVSTTVAAIHASLAEEMNSGKQAQGGRLVEHLGVATDEIVDRPTVHDADYLHAGPVVHRLEQRFVGPDAGEFQLPIDPNPGGTS